MIVHVSMLDRYEGNPILKPVKEHTWESGRVFNCAAVYDGGKVHLLYRAMSEEELSEGRYVSRLGYASTSDGFHIDERLERPVFVPERSFEYRGCEDPRITRIKDDYHMCYTAYGEIAQVAMTSIRVQDFLGHRWIWGDRTLAFPQVDDKDAVLFPEKIGGRYVMYHRIPPHIWVAYSYDLRRWFGCSIVMAPREGNWDCKKIGAGAPPIKTEEGWLLIYHGVDEKMVYRLGIALIDLRDPERVLYRAEEPILEPKEDYEVHGAVRNVVFTCGAVLLDGELFVYYGAADTVIGVATADVSELLP